MTALHSIWHLFFILLACIVFVIYSQDVKKASQCFKSRGIPNVDFSCDSSEMIKINRAFHGIMLRDRRSPNALTECVPSPGHESNNCTFCEGDCVDDSMNLVYDWSTCMGNTSCKRTVMQSYMPSCPGRDKFSDYLQVEYQCIPRSSVIDICTKTEEWLSEGYLMSPNYPYHYPINQDCMCSLKTDSQSNIVLSFYDLLLQTRKGRCRADWLMLRQNGQKHRHCGAIMTGTKNLTSSTNSIVLQFHTDENNNQTQSFQYFTRNLKGFWLTFKAEPTSSINVRCRPLKTSDREVQEIFADDKDYDELVKTKNNDIVTEDSKENTNMDKYDNDKLPGLGVPGKEPGVIKNKNPRNRNKGSGNEANFQGGASRSKATHGTLHQGILGMNCLIFFILYLIH